MYNVDNNLLFGTCYEQHTTAVTKATAAVQAKNKKKKSFI